MVLEDGKRDLFLHDVDCDLGLRETFGQRLLDFAGAVGAADA